MTDNLTDADRRGAALIGRFGGASVVRFRGFWLCGTERIAQVTITRLLRAGIAYRDPENPHGRVMAAHSAQQYVREYNPVESEDGTDLFWEEDIPPETPVEDDVWSPPDLVDAAGNPIPVDRAMEDY